MKNIKIEGRDYILLSKQEYDVLLDDAHVIDTIDTTLKVLQKGDLSPTESQFIEHLRDNVKQYERIIAKQTRMDGMGIAIFRFHLRDIG